MIEAEATVLVNYLLGNAPAVVALIAFLYMRHRDRVRTEQHRLVEAAARGAQVKAEEQVAAEIAAVRGMLEEFVRRSNEMDHQFWSDRWPPLVQMIERTAVRVDGHEQRIGTLEQRLDAAS